MKVTIQFPDNPLLESPIQFRAQNDGYRSIEDWSASMLVDILQADAYYGDRVYAACDAWQAELQGHYKKEGCFKIFSLQAEH